MILTTDVDLAQGMDPMPYRGKVWILVRWEERTVGEMTLDDADLLLPSSVERKAVEVFAHRIHALSMKQSLPNVASPSVSVVVVAGESAALLDRCLDAVAAADPPPLEVLLVAGQGVVPELPEEVRLSPTGRACDDLAMIVEAARGEVIAIVDGRCRPDRRFVASFSSAFGDAAVAAVTGIITPFRFDTHPQLAFDHHVLRQRDYKRRLWSSSTERFEASLVHPSVGGGIAWRRADLKGIGLNRLSGLETRRQVELAVLDRLVGSGKTVSHDPDVVMWHIHPRTRGELLGWVRAEARDRLAYVLHSERHWFRRVSASMMRDVTAGVTSAWRGRQLHLQADLVDLATTSVEAWRHMRAREPNR